MAADITDDHETSLASASLDYINSVFTHNLADTSAHTLPHTAHF
jgi:hypothetical protein